MNSWHSFSPNGRWLVFSSKSRSPYTQMFLTHIDAEGRDSPAILIENSTAANRAVNIPEFVNIAPNGIERIARSGGRLLPPVRRGRGPDEERRATPPPSWSGPKPWRWARTIARAHNNLA